MRPILFLVVGAATLVGLSAGLSAAPASVSGDAVTATSPFLPSPPLRPPPRLVFYGNPARLDRTGARWELRVDPAAFLEGETARRAAVADGVIAPGEPLPNDYYVRNESRRLLVYRVARNARVTVITGGIRATRVTVTELAALLRGRNPQKRRLFGPLSGFWIQARGDTVLSMDQQYRP